MDEIDKSVFKIPGFESAETPVFAASETTQSIEAKVIAPIESKDIVPKEIVVKKEADPNFYNELTAISEEILECRSKILEIC